MIKLTGVKEMKKKCYAMTYEPQALLQLKSMFLVDKCSPLK